MQKTQFVNMCVYIYIYIYISNIIIVLFIAHYQTGFKYLLTI